MKRVRNIFSKLGESLWFVPMLMLAVSMGLAIGLVEFDTYLQHRRLTGYGFFFGLGADGSRGMLTAIGSSMLTIAALTFSLTLLAVSQASGQHSPRVIRGFLRDRASQFVLGFFVSVFAYCLIVLRTIRGGDETSFVPSISVLTGLVMAIGGVIVLIFFIHHIAASLQVGNIIDDVVRLTRATIDERFPDKAGTEQDRAYTDPKGSGWTPVPSLSSGYIEDVDVARLQKCAAKRNFLVLIERDIGDFVPEDDALAWITGRDSGTRVDADTAVIDDVNSAIDVGIHRMIQQDVKFGILQLVDIALKALSPGINDTTTALICIDRLGEIAGVLAERRLQREDAELNADVIMAREPGLREYVRECFEQIRHEARGKLRVLIRLADAISYAASKAANEERHQMLLQEIELVDEIAARTLETDNERRRFSDHLNTRRIAFEKP